MSQSIEVVLQSRVAALEKELEQLKVHQKNLLAMRQMLNGGLTSHTAGSGMVVSQEVEIPVGHTPKEAWDRMRPADRHVLLGLLALRDAPKTVGLSTEYLAKQVGARGRGMAGWNKAVRYRTEPLGFRDGEVFYRAGNPLHYFPGLRIDEAIRKLSGLTLESLLEVVTRPETRQEAKKTVQGPSGVWRGPLVRQGHAPGKGRTYSPASQALYALFKDLKPHGTKEMQEIMRQHGKSPSLYSTVCTRLVRHGFLKRINENTKNVMYVLA